MIDFGFGIELGRIHKDSHIDLIYKWRNNYKNIWKWCRQSDILEPIKHEKWFETISADPTIEMYGIYDGHLIGVCGLTDINRLVQRAEFSLYIAPEYQGKGHAQPALQTLFSHGFMNHNLNLIWGETFEGNHAQEIFIKIGMKYEGTRRQFYFKEGKHIDAHLISMTRQEFEEAPWKQSQL
jgi:RimJ/RimL family protein N-acetyltransferase